MLSSSVHAWKHALPAELLQTWTSGGFVHSLFSHLTEDLDDGTIWIPITDSQDGEGAVPNVLDQTVEQLRVFVEDELIVGVEMWVQHRLSGALCIYVAFQEAQCF